MKGDEWMRDTWRASEAWSWY